MWLFLLVKLLVYIAEIVWICLSTYWIFGYTLPCNYRTIWIVRGAVLWSWFIRFLKLVWTIVVLSPWISYVPRIDGPRSLGKAASKVAGYGHQTYDLWEKRFVLTAYPWHNIGLSKKFFQYTKFESDTVLKDLSLCLYYLRIISFFSKLTEFRKMKLRQYLLDSIRFSPHLPFNNFYTCNVFAKYICIY